MARGTAGTQLDSQAQKEPLEFSAWVEVDLSALERNLKEADARTTAAILPILKGDAYGHGAPVVAAFLKSRGCSAFGVSTVEEALDILHWTRAHILLLTPPLPGQLPLVAQHKMTATVTSPETVFQLNRLARMGRTHLSVQIKVDTGFGRLGVAPQDFVSLAETIANASHLHLGGVFTHFPAAASDRAFTRQQLKCFLALKDTLPHAAVDPPVFWHAANSAAFLTLPDSHLDLVRLGTLLYGQVPVPPLGWELQETWRFKARIIQTRWLPPGHSVGYGRTYRTTRPTRIGVIPVGYAHGLELEPAGSPLRQLKRAAAKALFPRHPVVQETTPLPILGRIGMGLSCLDLTGSLLAVGDVVTVHMRRTVVGRQIPRFYYVQGELRCIFWNNQLFSPQGKRISLKGLF